MKALRVWSRSAARSHTRAPVATSILMAGSEPVADALEDSPLDLTPRAHSEWLHFASCYSEFEARIVAGRLSSEGVPAIVETIGAFPGLFASVIWVPKVLAHRARWLLAWPPFTDAELTFLATGELSSVPPELP